jgi:hypothetical protein
MNVNVVGSSRSSWQGVAAAIGVLIVAGATGCKMGTAGTKPSWWSFGGGSKEDAAKLAAAPTFNGGTEKPSASAKPYPTTTTPNGYVLNGSTPPAAGTVAGESVAAAAPVTYGVTPPPAKAAPVAVATAPASAPAAAPTGGSLASISPQVGPYGALPSEPPAAQSQLPPLQPIAAAAPAVSDASGYGYGAAPPQAAPVTPPGGQRVADARGAAGWPAQQSAPASAGSRYDSVIGSRFGGGGSAIDQPLSPPAASALPTGAMPVALEPLPAGPPSAAAPLAPLSPPPSVPATGFPLPPAGAPPAAPPTRRPDPGYRPGGTSSYRPNRAILAAEPLDAEPGGVRTVGFEAPAAAGP